MSRFVDAVVGYRILRMLSIPIRNSDAFKLGIIDQDGEKIKDPVTNDELNSYSLLQRFIFKVQKALLKSPDRNAKRLLTFAAALAILREYEEPDEDNVDTLLEVFMADSDVQAQAVLLENGLLSFRNFQLKEEMMGVGGGAIAGIGTGPTDQREPGRDPVFMPLGRRKKKKKINGTVNS
jgi:hypothetical protein|tara:strand:- start:3235 stop:3771 length:537 start_codon:yes stop_codon:yes gene_type:complete